MKLLKDLDLMDNFLFDEAMNQEEMSVEFCRILLSTILQRDFKNIRVVPQKSVQGVATGQHGIRMDAYIEAEECTEELSEEAEVEVQRGVYDIEPNKYSTTSEAKRTRYYHSLIDSKIFKAGIDYEKLKDVVVIMIMPYDPFGMNRMVYTMKTRCVEEPDIPYDDGVTTIYLYTNGYADNPRKELKELLHYLQHTTEENAVNDDLQAVQKMVDRIKNNEEVGVHYMKSWEYEIMIREEAQREGREAGMLEGREAGMREGRLEGEVSKVISMVCTKLAKGKSVSVIADELEENVEYIQRICEIAENFAPEYDVEKIYECYKSAMV